MNICFLPAGTPVQTCCALRKYYFSWYKNFRTVPLVPAPFSFEIYRLPVLSKAMPSGCVKSAGFNGYRWIGFHWSSVISSVLLTEERIYH